MTRRPLGPGTARRCNPLDADSRTDAVEVRASAFDPNAGLRDDPEPRLVLLIRSSAVAASESGYVSIPTPSIH